MLTAVLAATALTSAHADQKRGHAFSILNDIAISLWHTSIRGVAVFCLVVWALMFDTVQVQADSSLVLRKWADKFIKPSISQHKNIDILWNLRVESSSFYGLGKLPNQPIHIKAGKHGIWTCNVRGWAVMDSPEVSFGQPQFTTEIVVFRFADFTNNDEPPAPFKHKSETHKLPLGAEKGSHYDFETTLNWRPASEDAGYYFFLCIVKDETPEINILGTPAQHLFTKFYNEVPPDAFQVSITKPQGTFKSTQPIPFRAVAKDPLFVPDEIKTFWERRIDIITITPKQSQVLAQEPEVQNPNLVTKKPERVLGSPGWEKVYEKSYTREQLEAIFYQYSDADSFQIADPALQVSGQYRVRAISTPPTGKIDGKKFGLTSTAWQYFTVELGQLIVEAAAGKATVQPGSKEVQVKPGGPQVLEGNKLGKVEKKEFAKGKTGGGFVPRTEMKTMKSMEGESPFVPGKKIKMQGGKAITKQGDNQKKNTAKIIRKPLRFKPAELELKIVKKPAQVCPNKIYNVQVRVINHGSLPARYHLCRVGTYPQGCEGNVREIKGNSTANFFMKLKPDPSYFEGGKWHGKLFLGKVKARSQNEGIKSLGGNNQSNQSSESQGEQIADPELYEGSSQSTEPPDCNVGVSTSWKQGGFGMAVGSLFCDSNMNNHLVKLEINSNSTLCNPKKIKKQVIMKQSQPGNKKKIIKPKTQKKQPGSSNSRKIIKPAIQEKRSKPGNKKILPKPKVEDKESKTIRKKTIIKPKIQLK